MTHRQRLVGQLALALALLAAACSSSDNGDAAGVVAEPPSDPVSDMATEPEAETPTVAPTPPPEPEPTPDEVPPPISVEGPVTGGAGQANAALLDLAAVGYVESEYFFAGDAQRFRADGVLPPDGRWMVVPDGSAPFRSRMIVRRPSDPADFSGVVLVEWLNVSGGVDGDPDWGYTSDEIIREGHAWVGVSAQQVGVSGGQSILGGEAAGLVGTDAARYGTLEHPGDAYSFDIYTQAGRALTAPDGPAPLGDDIVPERVIAIGESQSAAFLTTYINAAHLLAGVFDGFLVHSRPASAPGLTDSMLTVTDSEAVLIRTDLDEPTLVFVTETDLTVLGYHRAPQDDSDTVRTWEVAGTAHADAYLLEEVYGEFSAAITEACPGQINRGPQHQTLKAALHHLVAWVVDGTEPPVSPRLAVTADPASEFGAVIDRDELGNALGGIRTPAVEVPIASLSGDPVPGGPGFCFLFGSTTPFDAATLGALYPSRDAYVEAYAESLAEAVEAGFILPPEAEAMLAAAEASDIPG